MRNLIYILSAIAIGAAVVDSASPNGIGLSPGFIEACKFYGFYALLINSACHVLEYYWIRIKQSMLAIGQVDVTSLEVRTFALIPMFLLIVISLLGDSGSAVGGAIAQSSSDPAFWGLIAITASLALGTFGVGLSPLIPKTEKFAIGVFIAGAVVIGLTSTFNSFYNRIAINESTSLTNTAITEVFDGLKEQSEELKIISDNLIGSNRLTEKSGDDNALSTIDKRTEHSDKMLAAALLLKPETSSIYGSEGKATGFMFFLSAANSYTPFIFSFLFALLLKSVVRDRKIEAAKQAAKKPVEYHVPTLVEVPIPTYTTSMDFVSPKSVEKTVETLSDKGLASPKSVETGANDRQTGSESTGEKQKRQLPDNVIIFRALDKFRQKNPKRQISKSFVKDAMKSELDFDLGSSTDQSSIRDMYLKHINKKPTVVTRIFDGAKA